ncbi:acyltransferase family protein [Acinetobacter sp.]|uniref:acyltransferase family protein n=1 Tax=Acinetobacter sp. TaxID=472 RepID=UPI0028AF0838|nr:acyltransferase family protein [Acinetobacter sp.]
MTQKQFRDDIQGLRAIAVLAVILYHFQVSFFKGGFVGVDIFFVISGYLISKSIIINTEQKKFNFKDFYFSRIKRLYPAFLATIIITYIIGFFIFSPLDFEALSATTIFSTVGFSNIYFWFTSGYFDNFSTLKPLLHTWSLSVEFQFYMIWPLILLFIVYLRKLYFIFLSLIIFISGFISYKYLSYDSTGVFFLMPFRIHEFSIGALVFILERKFLFTRLINNLIYFFGLLLIIFSILKFNNTMAFPGIIVWIPVIGTSLIIYAGSNISFEKIVSLKSIQYIGEISYSLYLVHWPVFVFFIYIFPEITLNYRIKLLLLFTTFILSIILYNLVEKRFRNTLNFDKATYLSLCQSFIIIILLASASSFIGKGWVWRLPVELQEANNINIQEMHEYTWEYQRYYASKKQFDQNGKEKILIIGDSQSADLINLLKGKNNDKNFDIVARTIYTECNIPYINESIKQKYYEKINFMTMNKPDVIPTCNEQINYALSDKKLFEKADRIFIAFNWNDFTTPYINTAFDKIENLANSNKKIWVFGRKDLSKSSVELFNLYSRKKYTDMNDIDKYAAKFKKEQNIEIDKILRSRPGLTYINMYNLICPSEISCKVLTDDKKIIFYDGGHFGPDGAKFLSDKFYNLIKIN